MVDIFFLGERKKAVEQQMLQTERAVVNVTGCLLMNNIGLSVRKKKKKIGLFHQSELRDFLSSGDTCCSDLVAMVTVTGLTEIKHLMTVA